MQYRKIDSLIIAVITRYSGMHAFMDMLYTDIPHCSHLDQDNHARACVYVCVFVHVSVYACVFAGICVHTRMHVATCRKLCLENF